MEYTTFMKYITATASGICFMPAANTKMHGMVGAGVIFFCWFLDELLSEHKLKK